MEPFAYIILFSLILFRVSYIDIKSRQIPNIYLVSIIIISLLCVNDIPLLQRLIEAIIISIPLIAIWLICKSWLGAGDIKLIFGCTLMLGIDEVLHGLLFGMIVAGVLGLVCRLKKYTREIPLSPFISLGTMFVVFIK